MKKLITLCILALSFTLAAQDEIFRLMVSVR